MLVGTKPKKSKECGEKLSLTRLKKCLRCCQRFDLKKLEKEKKNDWSLHDWYVVVISGFELFPGFNLEYPLRSCDLHDRIRGPETHTSVLQIFFLSHYNIYAQNMFSFTSTAFDRTYAELSVSVD